MSGERDRTGQRHDARKWLDAGKDAYNTRDYCKAEVLFRRALAEDPGYGRAHYYLGNTLYKLNRQGEALECWQKTVLLDPKSESAEKARKKIEMIDAQQARLSSQMVQDIQERRNLRHPCTSS